MATTIRADALRAEWLAWSPKHRPARDIDDLVEVVLAWPPAGTDPVKPYVVEAEVMSDDETTTVHLRLYSWDGQRFSQSHDYVSALIDEATHDRLELADIVVDSVKLRGQGRGSALLNALENVCRQRRVRWIHGGIFAADDAPELVNFYRHRGFTVAEAASGEPFEWAILKEVAVDTKVE